MAEVRIELEITGKEVQQLEDALHNKQDLMEGLAEVLHGQVKRRFANQAGPDGAKWKALHPLTIALRGRAGPALKVSGDFLGSIKEKVGGNVIRQGSDKPQAGLMQFGGTVEAKGRALAIPLRAGVDVGGGKLNKSGVLFLRRVRVPGRPYLGIGDKDETELLEEVEAYIQSAVE